MTFHPNSDSQLHPGSIESPDFTRHADEALELVRDDPGSREEPKGPEDEPREAEASPEYVRAVHSVQPSLIGRSETGLSPVEIIAGLPPKELRVIRKGLSPAYRDRELTPEETALHEAILHIDEKDKTSSDHRLTRYMGVAALAVLWRYTDTPINPDEHSRLVESVAITGATGAALMLSGIKSLLVGGHVRRDRAREAIKTVNAGLKTK